jgi:hypothetical protein
MLEDRRQTLRGFPPEPADSVNLPDACAMRILAAKLPEETIGNVRDGLAEQGKLPVASASGHEHKAGQKDETLVGIGVDFTPHAVFSFNPGLHVILQWAAPPVTGKDVLEVAGQQFDRGAHVRVAKIRVGSVVPAVHQARFGSKIQFAQSPLPQIGGERFRRNVLRRRHKRPEKRIHTLKKFGSGMATQKDTLARGLGAEQTGARWQPEPGAIDLGTVGMVNVYIDQACRGIFRLDGHGGAFGLDGWQVGRCEVKGAKQVPSRQPHLQSNRSLESVLGVTKETGQPGTMLIVSGNVGAEREERSRIARLALPEDAVQFPLARVSGGEKIQPLVHS